MVNMRGRQEASSADSGLNARRAPISQPLPGQPTYAKRPTLCTEAVEQRCMLAQRTAFTGACASACALPNCEG